MEYGASVLKLWWKIFPTFNAAKSKAWPKFREILLIRLQLVTQ